MKSKEVFHASLLKQYRQMILEALIECEHDYKTKLDICKLNQKLQAIVQSAKLDGIAQNTIYQLIDECKPSSMSLAA